ncbi:DELLA protein [Actinidia chinensis var. chinensis]|uniref:DELLA protein n=1 Tax=Actinidia chinensis var. chinensis TaxID=1590841 RepID=A0A2R6P5N7_ACTCC|nr:DELLA protein [Actinidia chinensis var. chinensis]
MMENAFFSSTLVNFNEIQGVYSALKELEIEEVEEERSFDMEGWKEIGFSHSHYAFHQEKMGDEMVHCSDYGVPNNFPFSGIPFPEVIDQFTIGKPKRHQFSRAPFELLSNYGSSPNRARDGNVSSLTNQACVDDRKLSTEEIIRMAGERYIQFSTQNFGGFSTFMHPYGCGLLGLSTDETTKDIELAQVLLSAADKVGYQQFDSASRLLLHCESMASEVGNPVQRIVYYYAEALRERIDRETGNIKAKRAEERGIHGKCMVLGPSEVFLAHHQKIPFILAIQCAGMQKIIESVVSVSAPKVHLIDLQIRNGTHWTILMQALAENNKCPIKLMKITTVGTTNKHEMEGTCERLVSFAKSLNLPFSFKVVFLSDMKDFKKEQIDTEPDEIVVVYSPTVLRSMISRPECLESVMRVIQRLKPALMVVNEIEANYNSPSFVKRFVEALFSHSAHFDCLEDCMQRDDKYRMVLEGTYFRDGILNIVAAKDEERIERSVRIGVWRAFFARFGMMEIGLSESSLYQARLVVDQFACGSSCTLDKNGKCLVVGWKGTPLHSLSTWKFL